MTQLSDATKSEIRHNLVTALNHWEAAEGDQKAGLNFVDRSDDLAPPYLKMSTSVGDLADDVIASLERGLGGDVLWETLELSTKGGDNDDSRARFESFKDTVRSAQQIAEDDCGPVFDS